MIIHSRAFTTLFGKFACAYSVPWDFTKRMQGLYLQITPSWSMRGSQGLALSFCFFFGDGDEGLGALFSVCKLDRCFRGRFFTYLS